MQGHPIAQTKKNCIDIQVKSHSAEIEVGFHTQSFTHSTLRTSFSSLFLVLLLPSNTTPLFVSLIHLASNNKESNNPSSIDTSYSHSDSKVSGQRADRQVRGLCHPKLVRRHPDHRDIALNHTFESRFFRSAHDRAFPSENRQRLNRVLCYNKETKEKMEDEKEEQRVTKGDREEKTREKKGKRGKVALQHFLGNEFYVEICSLITCMDASILAS